LLTANSKSLISEADKGVATIGPVNPSPLSFQPVVPG
jgi:hypothetical protein